MNEDPMYDGYMKRFFIVLLIFVLLVGIINKCKSDTLTCGQQVYQGEYIGYVEGSQTFLISSDSEKPIEIDFTKCLLTIDLRS